MRFPGLGSWIERRAAFSPDDVALVVGGSSLTYRELEVRVHRTATTLRRRGIEPGDRVAYHGVNRPAALTSLFASAAIGAVWVPIHPARPEDEVRWVLEDSGASLLVRGSPRSHPRIEVPEIDEDELEAFDDEPLDPYEATPDDLAILGYTSGTTGPPKGAMLTHENVLWSAVQMLAVGGFSRSDVTLAAAPFTRMGGLGVTVLPTLFAGGSIVVPGDVDGPAVLEAIERKAVTVVFANPDLLERIVEAPRWEAADLSSIRTGVVGGAIVPEALLRAYLDRGVTLRHGYGLTEAAPVVSLLDEREAMTRVTSVGRPLPFVEVRAVRPDGSPCDPDEVGGWLIRGPNVCAGYWRHAPLRDPDGWFPTGDVGSIGPDGHLTFVDRASSAMTIGDGVVYPATIERALYGVPGVSQAAAVEIDGRIVVAVMPTGVGPFDPDDLMASLRTSLGPREMPSLIRPVTSIPRNAAGKILRDELRRSLR
jgi:fatty-acyl-CoA synthase